VVSILALAVAAVGTAAALPGHNAVRSNDIKDGQVKRADLADDQQVLWALVDGSSDTIIKSSGGVTIANGGSGFDYVKFPQSAKGRAIHVTPQCGAEPDFVNAVICGPDNAETTECDTGGTNSKLVYVDTGSSDGNYYVAAMAK
jgi:hypothetical protein